MLEASIYNVARRALKSGIVPGDVVATLISDSILHAVVVLGLMHARGDNLVVEIIAPVSWNITDVVLMVLALFLPAPQRSYRLIDPGSRAKGRLSRQRR